MSCDRKLISIDDLDKNIFKKVLSGTPPNSAWVLSVSVSNVNIQEADPIFKTWAQTYSATFANISHKTRHQAGGADAIKLDELDVPTDVTTLDSTINRHGLLPKLSGNTNTYLRGDGNWTTPPGGGAILQLKCPEINITSSQILTTTYASISGANNFSFTPTLSSGSCIVFRYVFHGSPNGGAGAPIMFFLRMWVDGLDLSATTESYYLGTDGYSNESSFVYEKRFNTWGTSSRVFDLRARSAQSTTNYTGLLFRNRYVNSTALATLDYYSNPVLTVTEIAL